MEVLEEVRALLLDVKTLLENKDTEPMLLTIEKAAKKIGIGKAMLNTWIKENRDFPAIKNGNKWMVKIDKVGDWLDKHNKKRFV